MIGKKRLYREERKTRQMHIGRRYIVLAIIAAVLFLGIVLGDFNETWRNGATL